MSDSLVVNPGAAPRSRSMRRILIIVAAVLTLGGGAGVAVALRKPPAPLKSRSIGARLDLAAGDVSVTEDGSATSVKALSGAPLAIGSHVATGKGARALVRTGDGAAVFLRADTEIVLGERGIDVLAGEVWLDAPRVEGSSIEVSLGKHVASASDAGLSIRRAGEDVTVYVARGLSILTSPGGRVEINAGEEASAKGADAPKVSPVAFWQDWTGGMADARAGVGRGSGSGSGRIYGIDPSAPAGSAARRLGIAKQTVKAVVRDGVAETEVDQTFSNPSGVAIEGYYWFTVPPQATVVGFALETNGQLIEGEIVEKREALAKYEAAVRKAQDPALLEWVDGKSYRARIFPIPASGTRRVVLRYTELLPTVEGKMRYVYPLRDADGTRFDEFALTADLGAAGAGMQIATSLDARVEAGGKLVTMRRSGYVPRADFQLEMATKEAARPLRAWRFAAGADQADYVMLRYVPEIDFATLPPVKGTVVLVVDTSAGGDDGARQLRAAAAEAILRALSDDDRFALVALDVAPRVLYPKDGLAPATSADIAKALELLSEHAVGGATDLGAMFEPALERLHGAEQPAIVYVGDGAPTSGETTADALLDRLRRSLSGSRARLFGVGVGSGARHDLMTQLARAGGGQYVRIDEAEQTTGQALRLTSVIKTPTMTDVEVNLGAALDQPFYSASGKLSRGEELVLLARTHHALPPTVTIKGRLGGKDVSHEYALTLESSVTTALVPRLWAAEYVRRLLGSGAGPDDNRAKVLDLGLEYGLMTPYTSFLALDSEAAYARQGIGRRSSRVRGVRLSMLDDATEQTLGASFQPGLPRALGGCESRKESSPERGAAPMPAPQNLNANPARGAGEDLPAPEERPVDGDHEAQNRSAGDLGKSNGPAAAAVAPASPVPQTTAQAIVKAEKRAEDDSKVALKSRGVPLQPTPAKPPPQGGGGAVATTKDTTDRLRDKPKESDYRDAPADRAGYANARFAAIPRRPLGACSDAAGRPLAERIVLWEKRLRRATQAVDLVNQYEMARAACELPDWRDQAALLDRIQAQILTEEAAEQFLAHLQGEVDAQRFVARAILRRTVDARLAAAVSRVLFGGKVDWARIDRELLDADKPEARMAALRTAMLVAPGDPSGDVRLVRLLAESGDRAQAISYGRRLRDRGLLTPVLAQQLGDVLAEAGEKDEALRTYSEVVEFDPGSAVSRRVLGDVYLRQGWYAAAYRQYKTLTDLDAKSPEGWLRLAAAAAGTGRVDEAFRIERDVAGGEGSPGPADPRYWSRLWSAARLGVLAGEPANAAKDTADAIQRKLKTLQLFSGPGTLAVLTWEDLDARLALTHQDRTTDALAGEVTDAGTTGLYAVFTATESWDKTAWAVAWKGDTHGRAAKFQIVLLTWNGKAFAVSVKRGSLAANARQARVE